MWAIRGLTGAVEASADCVVEVAHLCTRMISALIRVVRALLTLARALVTAARVIAATTVHLVEMLLELRDVFSTPARTAYRQDYHRNLRTAAWENQRREAARVAEMEGMGMHRPSSTSWSHESRRRRRGYNSD